MALGDRVRSEPNRLSLTLGAYVRGARERARLSQPALARLAGVNYSSISHYETGKSIPPVAVLIAIGRATGTPAGAIVQAVDEQLRERIEEDSENE